MTATSDIRSRGVSAFVAEWFDLLSEHVSVDRMTEYLAPDGMEMVFPDQTLHGVGDFRDWYAALGRSYTNQTHDVEKVLTTLSGDFVDVAIVVVWRGVDTSDGTRLVFRMRQNWRLRPIPAPPRFAMVRYRVDDMTAI